MIGIIRLSILRIALLAIALFAIGAGITATRASPTYPDEPGTAATTTPDVTATSRHDATGLQSPRYPSGQDSQSTRLAQQAPGKGRKGDYCGTDDNVCYSHSCTDCLENPHRCYCRGGEPPPGMGTAAPTVTATPKVTATIESIVGDVSYRVNEGEWADAVVGQRAIVNSDIHTGPDSEARIRFSDGSLLVIHEQTEAAIGDLSGARNQPKIRALLKMGEVAADIHHEVATEADFAVRTPNQTASVRGTVFAVSYDPEEGESDITVQEGQVLVTPANTSLQPLLLGAGQRVSVSMDEVGPVENAPRP